MESAESLRKNIKNRLEYNEDPLGIEDDLVGNYGFARDEAEQTIKDIKNDLYKPREEQRDLRLVEMQVPQAFGDEEVSIAALQAAGMSPVKRFNIDNSFATDIEGNVDGQIVGIDAQQRANRQGALNISAVLNDPRMVSHLEKCSRRSSKRCHK